MPGTYAVRIRLNGTVSLVTVYASDSSRARMIVRAQYAGAPITILHTERVR
jgi:hypothetical protein